METTEERLARIRIRTAQLRRERRQRRLTAVATAACLLLLVGLGLRMPTWMEQFPRGTEIGGDTASLLAAHPALGYIIMALLAFLLGMCVTVLLYRLRDGERRRAEREEGDDEH